MSQTLQYGVVAIVLAGCVWFVIKTIIKNKRHKSSCCGGCTIKDFCDASAATNSQDSARQCMRPDQRKR